MAGALAGGPYARGRRLARACGPAVLLLGLLPAAAMAQDPADPRYVRAFSTLYTTSQLGALVKAWCDVRAPELRAATDTALAAWRAAHQLDDVESRADAVLGSQRGALDAGVQERRATVFRALDRESKAPVADCRQLRAYLERSANPERLHAAEHRLVMGRRAADETRSPAAVGPAAPPTGSAERTVYTVGQLAAFVTRDRRSAETRLRQLGSLTVRGTLAPYDTTRPDETVWLNTVSDGWRSRIAVQCYDVSFRRWYDTGRRTVVLRGRVRSVESWITLEDCRLLTDTTGLTPAVSPDSGGLARIDVRPAQVRTAPNAGLPLVAIEGVYQPAQLRYNPMSMLYEADETTYLLLRDGWLYDNLMVSPHDLHVAESRRLEPQHWHRWRRRGSVLEQQTYDEYGRTDGTWTPLDLVARPPIGARKLNGVFAATSSATAGLPGGGGAVSIARTSFTFRPDGTFVWVNFTQGFASSTTGTGQGGATVVVGGATVGPNGTSVSTVGGGEEAGTYVITDYTLELRTRKGVVHRFPIFAWDADQYRDYLVIDGVTYSPPK